MTTSNEPRPAEWHIRRARPDARTTTMYFIDADANRMTYAQFFDALEGDEEFRKLFIQVLADSDLKLFVWETPSITKRTAVGEFECAITPAPPPPKRFRVDPDKFAAHYQPEELTATFTDGDMTCVAPSPREAEGWYGDLGTFIRRVRPAQVNALFQSFASAVKQSLGDEKIWLSSSAPGAPWLHLRIEKNNKSRAYVRYGR